MREQGSGLISDRADIDGKGALAQLGERNTGSVEVSGSIPLGSTIEPKSSRTSVEDFRTLADEVSSAGVFRVYQVLMHLRGVVEDV